jgi:DNA polymerase-4
MAQALRRCPQAVVIAPEHARYSAVSRSVMAILHDFTPAVEPLSVDEAFLDVSGSLGLFGRPADIARQIRDRVAGEQGLTCSVGVAPTKSVAKLASSMCKPNGMRVVTADGVLGFLHPLPVTALWGVGDKTSARIRALGILTVGDLAAMPADTLRRAVGPTTATHLLDLANGIDPRRVRERAPEKSVSTDRTVPQDLTAQEQVARELLRDATEVAERLRHGGWVARTVGIKIRFADFTTVTRVRTLSEPTDTGSVIFECALELYRSLRLDQPRIRLVGVKAENLRAADAPEQLTFDIGPARQPSPGNETGATTAAEAAIDAITERFGRRMVRPASLLPPGAGGLERGSDRGVGHRR